MNRIIFAGTPDIAAGVLQAVINAGYNVVTCLTQPDRPAGRGLRLTPSAVKTCALDNGIAVLQPRSLRNPEAVQQLVELKPDLMLVLAYGLILPQNVLDIPRLGCINIHASILPRWRGAAPIQHAILAGDVETGITIMQMDAGMDTGAMLGIYPCAINSTDTGGTLHDKLALLAQSSCLDILPKVFAGEVKSVVQDDALATYASKIAKSDAKINWSDNSLKIDRMIRAYNPWPTAFSEFMGEAVKIWEAEIVEHSHMEDPGTILDIDQKGIYVATGNGVLRIIKLQFPNKRALLATDICKSNKQINIGARFN